MKSQRTGCIPLCLFVLASLQQAACAPYEFVEIGTLGGNPSYATAINNSGLVVGYSFTSESLIGAFIWSATDGIRLLEPAPTTETAYYATDINDMGFITGHFGRRGGCPIHACVWKPEGFFDLGVLCLRGHCLSFGRSINDFGTVIGVSRTGGERWFAPFTGSTDRGLSIVEALSVDFREGLLINNHGEMILQAEYSEPSAFYLVDRSENLIPLYGFDSIGDLNDRGEIVGRGPLDSGYSPLIWKEGGYTAIPVPGSDHAEAAAINERSQVVGHFNLEGKNSDAFLWDHQKTVRLSQLLTEPGSIGLTYALDINDHGVIVGWRQLGGEVRPWLLQPSPTLHNAAIRFVVEEPILSDGSGPVRLGFHRVTSNLQYSCDVVESSSEDLIVDVEINCTEYYNSTAPSILTLAEFLVVESIRQINSTQDSIRAASTQNEGEVYLACEFPIVARLCGGDSQFPCDLPARRSIDNCGWYNLFDGMEGNESSEDHLSGLGIEFMHHPVARSEVPPLPTATATSPPSPIPTPVPSHTPLSSFSSFIPLPVKPDDVVIDAELPRVYFVSTVRNSIYRVDIAEGTISEPMVFSLPPERLDFSIHDRLIGVTLPISHEYNGPDEGFIGVVSADDWRIEAEHFIPLDPWDIAIDNQGFAYLTSGSNQHTNLKSINLASGDWIDTSFTGFGMYMRQNVRMNPRFDSVCLADTETIPRDRTYIRIRNGMILQEGFIGRGDGIGIQPHFRFSPQGDLLFSAEGNIFSVTSDCISNLALKAALPRGFRDIAFHEGSNTVLTVDGVSSSARRHNLETFADSGQVWPIGVIGEFVFAWNNLVVVLGRTPPAESASGWAVQVHEIDYFLSDPPPTPTATSTPTQTPSATASPTESPTLHSFDSDQNDRIDANDLIHLLSQIKKEDAATGPSLQRFSLEWMKAP